MCNRRCGLVVRPSASIVGGHGFDLRPRQTKVFRTGSSSFGTQDYGNSTITGLPVSG